MLSKVMASFSVFGSDFLSIVFIVLHSLEGSRRSSVAGWAMWDL